MDPYPPDRRMQAAPQDREIVAAATRARSSGRFKVTEDLFLVADRSWAQQSELPVCDLLNPDRTAPRSHDYPSSGRKDRLMRVTTASQERFSSWGYVRSKQWIAARARDEKLHRL